MPIISKVELQHYLKLNYNVLFSGLHGVGKTAIVKSVFEEAGLRWRYFSTSTMDPWVDFIGVPKVMERTENGKVSNYLELIKPEFMMNDECDAIFMDELNRASDKKVINAVMELIQFKSINGHQLKNLKVIWGAINPVDEEDTYLVNYLDPAHLDRFHIHIDVPYKVDTEYFLKKYPDHGQIFIDWWTELPDQLKKLVSPRRLDYAADGFLNDCRLEAFLPQETNPKKLRASLKAQPFSQQIKQISDIDGAKAFLSNVNNATKTLDLVKSGDKVTIDFFIKYGRQLPSELIQPYAEWITARKEGFELVKDLKELIEKIPGDRGTSATAAFINNVNFEVIYAKSGSLHNDVVGLHKQHPELINKLASRMTDVIISGTRPATLKNIFWGLEGPEGGKHTNFYTLLKSLKALRPTLFSGKHVSVINNKLYSNGVVKDMNFL